MAKRRPDRISLFATCACVILGCCIGFTIWHFTVWRVYYAKSSPQPFPFENFGEITRVLGIALGGIAGLVSKEIASRFVTRPGATSSEVIKSE